MGWLKVWVKGKVEKAKQLISKTTDRKSEKQNAQDIHVRRKPEEVSAQYAIPNDAYKKRKKTLTERVAKYGLPCLGDAFGKEHGKLPKTHYKKVRENFTYLGDYIDGKSFAGFFFEKGAFNEDDLEDVAERKTRKERTDVFMKKLLNSGNYGYNIFMHGLLKEGYFDVVEKLEGITIE